MADESPPWNKHGSHDSRVSYNTAGEHPENNDSVRGSFAGEEPISTLSSCMSGAFKSLLPDYPGTSSAMTENSVKYSCSANDHCLIKPGTVVEENVEDKSNFLKDSLGEASVSVKQTLPPRCGQNVTQEKDQQGNCNWTSVIKDALEMSNGMEMEQTLSMDACGPEMDINPVYKGPETEAKFTFNDHDRIAGFKLNEDGKEVKGQSDSFMSILSDDSKKKDVLEMEKNEQPSILDVGSSVEKEELEITGIAEHEPRLLPGFNRSSYTPFSSSKDFMKSEKFTSIPSVKESFEHALQGTEHKLSSKNISPRKTTGTNTCFKHAEVNNETVYESSAVYGLHYQDLHKGCQQAEDIDGKISPPSASLGSKSTAVVKGQNSNLRILTEEGTFERSPSVPGKTETVVQEISVNKNNAEFSLKVDACKHSQIEPRENDKINELCFQENNSKTVTLTLDSGLERTTDECDIQVQEKQTPASLRADLLNCDKKVQNSEKMDFLHIPSQSSIPSPENVQAAPLSPSSRTDCSPQHNQHNALQTHKKKRKRKISELEKLIGPIYKSNKEDNSSVSGSELSVSAIKSDTTRCEGANQNVLLPDHESTALKEQDLNTNGDANPSLSKGKSPCLSQLQASQLGPVADTSETSQDHSCSEASREKPQSNSRKNRKAICKRKLTKRTNMHLNPNSSATLINQSLSQSTVLSPEDDCTLHSHVSDITFVKEGSNSAVIQQTISNSEPSNAAKLKKSRKSLQSQGDPHEDVPTTFSELDADLVDFKRHKKAGRPSLKTSKGKNDKHAVGLPKTQCSLDSVTETLSNLSPLNNTKKARQNKEVDINKPTMTPNVCPQEDIPLPLPQNMVTSSTKTVKRKRSVKKVTGADGSVTTLLEEKPSIATLKEPDSVPTARTEGEAPAVLSSQRKSLKKKLSDVRYQAANILAVDQTVDSQLSESDASVTQPTIRRFRTRKTLNKNISHDAVTENYEPANLNQLNSSSVTKTCYSVVSQQDTEKTSSKGRMTNLKSMEEQPSTISHQEDITVSPSNPQKTVKRFCRNKINALCLNSDLVKETSLLAAETQENSVSPSKIDTSSSLRQSNTLKKTRKKMVTSIKNEVEEILINQHENSVAVPSKPGANMDAFSSEMTLEEKRPTAKAIRQEAMQTSLAMTQHTECASTSFAQSTSKKLRKKSDIKCEAVHTSTVDQTVQKEIHSFELVSEERKIADVLQMTTKVKTKKHGKVTKHKSHVIGSLNIREQSVPGTTSNSKTTLRSEDMTNKCMTKRTSALKVSNLQPEDHAEHPTSFSALLPSPASLGKDATQGPCLKTDIVHEKAESHSHVENQVSIITEASPHRSLKKAKKTHGKQLLEQKAMSHQSNVLKLAHKKDNMSQVPSATREDGKQRKTSENSCDRHLEVSKKKLKKSNQIVETHGFANVSLIQDKNTRTDEAGVVVTHVQDFSKLSDGQTAGSQQPEKDDTRVDEKDLIKEETGIKVLKTTKRKSQKAGRKKRMFGGLLTQIVQEEEHEDVTNDNRIECVFQDNTQNHSSDSSQMTAVIQEEPVLKSRKSDDTQKVNSGPVVEKLSAQDKSTVSLDSTESHTGLGEAVSSSMQVIDCEDQYNVEQKPRRRGRPPKKKRLSIARLKDNTSSTVEISELRCQDNTENTNKAAASPGQQKDVQPFNRTMAVKVNENLTAAEQLGADPLDSPQSPTDPSSLSIPAPEQKKCKISARNVKLSSLRASSRISETSVKGFQQAETPSLPQYSINVINEEEKTSLPLLALKKQKPCEKTDIDEDRVLADVKIENKATIKVEKARKRGRKRRKVKEPSLDLATEHKKPQGLTTNTKNAETQDCCEPAKSLQTKFSRNNELSTEEQNNIVTSEENDVKLSSAEMIPDITEGNCKMTPKTKVLCSSTPYLSSTLMKKVKRYKIEEHNAEPSGKDSFEVSVQSYTDDTGVSDGASSGICGLISSNVVKKESEQTFLDPKIELNSELKCAQETDGPSVKMPEKKKVLNSPAFKPTDQKTDCFMLENEDCVLKPNKMTNKRKIRSKPKNILRKPLTCKYCGISFRHITAYTLHQRIHTGDKPYKCKICGKTFAQLSNLKSHRNVHKQETSFPCPCCSSKFLQKEDLLCHFKVHLQKGKKQNGEAQKDIKSKRNILSKVSSVTPNKYGCPICKKNFVNHVKLQDHKQEHEMEKPLSCKDCGKKFWKQSNLTAHEKTHWPVKPYACSICGKGFNQLKALKKHSQNHAGETPFSCFHCGHAFNVLSSLRMHQASKTCIARKNDEASGNVEGFIVSQGVDGQVNTPKFFRCQICKQLFRKWCQYTLHLQTHTSSPPYICFSCGQCYEKDSEMNVHCEVCCQSSGEERICDASLSEIVQGVTKTNPLKCTSSRSLPSTVIKRNSQTRTTSEQLTEPAQTKDMDLSKPPSTISNHQLPIKLPTAPLPTSLDVNCKSTSSSLECLEITPSFWKFKCSRCGQRFEQYRTLSAHLQTHAPGFRYTCADCGQFFERWSKLWLHQQCHRLKARCYSCNQCNLQFRFYSSFKEHMIDHAGQRQYTCLLCPKTFIQEASLHAHQCESHKIHKSLKCDVCSKTFSSLRNLIKHSLLHNGYTSHICLSCNLSFTNARVLKEHLKTHITNQGPSLPDIPSKPLNFPHKCKRCKACFSTGDLLYAHQIRHSRDAKTLVRPAIVPTSKLPGSCNNETPSTQPPIRRNHISNLKLDSFPNDDSLYVYSHPDDLYVPPGNKEQVPVINLDPEEHEEASGIQNASPELLNNEIICQFDNTHLPQVTSSQETTNLNLSKSLKEKANGKHNYSHKYQTTSTFVETSVDMEVETPTRQESEESFECADCTEKLTSVLSLYEHYILHAKGDTYVRVH